MRTRSFALGGKFCSVFCEDRLYGFIPLASRLSEDCRIRIRWVVHEDEDGEVAQAEGCFQRTCRWSVRCSAVACIYMPCPIVDGREGGRMDRKIKKRSVIDTSLTFHPIRIRTWISFLGEIYQLEFCPTYDASLFVCSSVHQV